MAYEGVNDMSVSYPTDNLGLTNAEIEVKDMAKSQLLRKEHDKKVRQLELKRKRRMDELFQSGDVNLENEIKAIVALYVDSSDENSMYEYLIDILKRVVQNPHLNEKVLAL